MASANRTNRTEQLQRFINNLWQHQEKNQFCDFTLTTNNTGIECHKLVLSSASSYFSQLLCDSEHNTNMINVTPLPEHILRTVVAFMYNSEYVINDENVIELLKLSKTWHLDILTQLCVTYMNDNITINNACRFYNYASVNAGENNLLVLNAFIREHFTSLHESDQLRELSFKNFTTIIEHDVNVRNENVVFSSAMQIINQQTPAEDINLCLELIRFPHMSGDFLLDVVQGHPLMKDPPRDKYVQEAIRHRLLARSADIIKPRRQWQTDVYYINKDLSLSQYVSTSGNNESTKVVSLPNWVDTCCSVTFNKRHLLVAGASNEGEGDKRVLLLDMSNHGSNQMIQLTDLPMPLYNTNVMMTENNDVYVIGGRTPNRTVTSSVYCLSLSSHAWQMKQPMLHAISRPLLVQHRQYIYVLGGFNNDGQPQSYVSQYNIENNTWKRCSDMPVACGCIKAGVVVQEGIIKVITVDKCLIYADDTDTWTVKQYNKLGDGINAFTKRGQIWAAVQDNDIFRIMRYDDVNNEWKTEQEKVDNALQVFLFC